MERQQLLAFYTSLDSSLVWDYTREWRKSLSHTKGKEYKFYLASMSAQSNARLTRASKWNGIKLLKDGTLVAYLNSGPLKEEFNLNKKKIAQMINAHMKKQVILRVRIQ